MVWFFVSIIWERTECKSDHYVCSILWCDYYRQITTCRQKEIVSSLLHDLDAISVRDENSMKVIEELTGRTPWLHVDPVLMFDYNQFIPDKFNRNEYIIVYTYPGRITDKRK